jgi:hypothetical protein
MKRLLVYVAFFVLAAVASAPAFGQNDAFIGTWKFNAAKSKYTNPPAPKELTRKLEADGDSVKYTYSGTAADGSAISYGFTVKYDGKDYPVTGSMPGGADMIAIKKTGPSSLLATQKKGGKAIGTAKVQLSKDGKSATVTANGTDESGKTISYVSVYDKE